MHSTIKVALIGQPNCGKSTFFNQLVGYRAQTSNFPGTTVEFLKAEVTYGDSKFEIIDLPGIYSLLGEEPAEKVTLKYILNNEIDVIVNVVDSSVLSRSLELTVEIASLRIPMILVLNMLDEAEKKGIKIDTEALKQRLGVEVIKTIAVQGKGVDQVVKSLKNARIPTNLLSVPFDDEVEKELKKVVEKIRIKHPEISEETSRILAIADLEGQLGIVPEGELIELKKIFMRSLGEKSPWLIMHHEKHKIAMELFEESAQIVHKEMGKSIDYVLDSVLMTPFFGPILALIILLLTFFIVQRIGTYLGPLLAAPFEFLNQQLKNLNSTGLSPVLLQSILDGLRSGVEIVFPYFIPFIFFISILEDIGYLPRLAFLLDHFLHSIGLHGKSVVPLILGLGCNVPAVFSSRIIESERERITTAFLIPLVPCSARLSIIFALSTLFLGPWFSFFLLVLDIFVIAILAKLISVFFKSELTDFILEIPPYRVPTLKSLSGKVWFKLKDFIGFALPVIIAGSIVLSLLQYFNIDAIINNALSIFTEGILELKSELGVVLIFGILRKELALIMASEALHTPVQMLNSVLSTGQIAKFVVFITFYTPCLSTILALWKETGIKWTLLQIFLSLTVATLLALLTGILFSL
ncbi:MAG: ferrous iron transport protein B [Candidatus Hydrothermia bacterium]|nr:ferrous iron transport protein B [Candidatus Hydrothermae bacterium]MDD3649706.1 ferrous iron transport protein B [Candidatus Hydrothermia bacterium]